MSTPPSLLPRGPATWFVVTLYVIIAPVFIFQWDYGMFSDFVMGHSIGMITAWWLCLRAQRKQAERT